MRVGVTKKRHHPVYEFDRIRVAVDWEQRNVYEPDVDCVLFFREKPPEVIWAGSTVFDTGDKKIKQLISGINDVWFLVHDGHVTTIFSSSQDVLEAYKSGRIKAVDY